MQKNNYVPNPPVELAQCDSKRCSYITIRLATNTYGAEIVHFRYIVVIIMHHIFFFRIWTYGIAWLALLGEVCCTDFDFKNVCHTTPHLIIYYTRLDRTTPYHTIYDISHHISHNTASHTMSYHIRHIVYIVLYGTIHHIIPRKTMSHDITCHVAGFVVNYIIS